MHDDLYVEGTVSLQSRLQKCDSLSTTDAEYIGAAVSCKEVLWMQNFLQELGMKKEKYNIFCNSESAIHVAKNSSFNSQTKNIDVRYHWIRDVVSSKLVQLEIIHTDKDGSDIATKEAYCMLQGSWHGGAPRT
jgi:hypothetical protein